MKNIIFDLGGVILYDTPISVLNEIDIDEKTYNELKRFFDNLDELDIGTESLEDRFNKCDFSDDIKDKYKDFLINYYKYRKIDMDLINLINILKDKKYNIYILSDNNMENYIYYKNSELFSNIDGWVISCEYNVSKKDGKLFEIFINKFHLDPSECYFIDDKISNIEKFKKYGVKGYLYNNDIDNLYMDMKNNGINI